MGSGIAGQVVLVTGAAGSIGSELCRQIAGFEPKLLIGLDQAESKLYEIDLELRRNFPDLEIVPVLGDIRDSVTINRILSRYRVESIFHAAAYKHVPVMEEYPLEAARNNVFGTLNLVEAAERHGVLHFLMISTDKAVNPTSVMGATKRITELLGTPQAGS